MREDQARRLEDIEERLIEVVIADADPQNWAGAGLMLADMDKATRGDASWCRKTAVQTVALAMQMRRLVADHRGGGGGGGAEKDPDPERAIEAAEAAAQALIARVTGVRKTRA